MLKYAELISLFCFHQHELVWWPNKLPNQNDVTRPQVPTDTWKKKSPASLWIKYVAQIRWADLGDHRQGIKWIKCFNPLQQEKKKIWLTDWQSYPNMNLWVVRDWLRWWGCTHSGLCLCRAQVSQRWICSQLLMCLGTALHHSYVT